MKWWMRGHRCVEDSALSDVKFLLVCVEGLHAIKQAKELWCAPTTRVGGAEDDRGGGSGPAASPTSLKRSPDLVVDSDTERRQPPSKRLCGSGGGAGPSVGVSEAQDMRAHGDNDDGDKDRDGDGELGLDPATLRSLTSRRSSRPGSDRGLLPTRPGLDRSAAFKNDYAPMSEEEPSSDDSDGVATDSDEEGDGPFPEVPGFDFDRLLSQVHVLPLLCAAEGGGGEGSGMQASDSSQGCFC